MKRILPALTLAMLLLAANAMSQTLPTATDVAMNLTVVNNSGYPDDEIFFIVICAQPPGYYDFRGHVFVPTPSFTLNAATMTASLAQIKAYSGNNTCTISLPSMGSTRVYFALGQNFNQMGGGFDISGPVMGPANKVLFDKLEMYLTGDRNINSTMVDFFSIAYTVTATRNTGETVTVGVTNAAETIFRAFEAIPLPADSNQQYGNPNVFKAGIVRNDDGDIVRVVAPKAAAFSDINAGAMPQMFTHFLDSYIVNHCWRPNRTFSFSDKLNSPAPYYGRVSADGATLSIYTDAAMTIPYSSVPTLPRPCNAWGYPNFGTLGNNWHNVGNLSLAANDIDWGFLLYGQSGWSSGPGAYWATDNVAMAIPISISRGVMHLDNGTVDWKNSDNYFQGLSGASTADYPIFYYAKILHQYGLAGHVYAFSYDDVYGQEAAIHFNNPAVTLTLYPATYHPQKTAYDLAADFDGDRKVDPAVYTTVNTWWVWMSSANYQRNGPFPLGIANNTPAAADFDGDRLADPAVFDNNGKWTIWLSSAGYFRCGPLAFGDPFTTPVPADFDGDGRADPAIFTTSGQWYIWLSSANYAKVGPYQFGTAGEAPAPGDFDGDRLADPAVCDQTGHWYFWLSSDGYARAGPLLFGGSGYLPVAGDFDNDGFADPAAVADNNWYIWLSSAGYIRVGPCHFAP